MENLKSINPVVVEKSEGWRNILKIIIPYILFVGGFQVMGLVIAGISVKDYTNFNPTPVQSFILTFSSLVGTISLIWIFRKYVNKKSFKSLGLVNEFIGADLIIGLIFGFIILLSGFLCLLLSKQIEFSDVQFNMVNLLLSIGTCAFVAVSEELLIRGYVLNNLMISYNKYVALLISALIFTLMHAKNPHINLIGILDVFIGGIFLGLAYIYTKNLWFPISYHFSWNFFQGTIFGFNVSGIEQFSVIQIKYNSANIWNGGEFGFEGSLLAIILELFSLLLFCLFYRNRFLNNKIAVEVMSKIDQV